MSAAAVAASRARIRERSTKSTVPSSASTRSYGSSKPRSSEIAIAPRASVVRPAAIYGPHNNIYDMETPMFLRLLQHRPILLPHSGLVTASYESLIDRSIANERVMAALASVSGSLGLFTAAIGLFGVLAFRVARRTSELAVRMVLGADRPSVVHLVLRDMAEMLVPGLVIGAAAAAVLTGLARSLLFGLTPTDPAAFGTAAGALATAALIAVWLPARRASSVNPVVALRHE